MRLYRRTRIVAGKARKSKHVHLDFTDHAGAPRTLTLFTDDSVSEDWAKKLDRLLACRTAHEPLTSDLAVWLERMLPKLRAKLAKWNILDAARAASGKALTAHVDDFEKMLEARGATEQYAQLTANRARAVVKGCGFERYSDIVPGRVLQYLADRRAGGLSAQSSNFYLQSFKAFCLFMVRERRATESPVAHLEGVNVKTDRRHDRRALTVEEARRLLEAARCGPVRYGMTGADRVALYMTAMESGLRWAELRSLTRASFNLDATPATATVEAGYSKHRRADVLPLRPATADALRAYLSLRLPDARAFPMPKQKRGAAMIRADLEAARAKWLEDPAADPAERERRAKSDALKYVDSAGRYADFHGTRHTFVTNVCAGPASPQAARALARHSASSLTDRYAHFESVNQTAALDALPDLTAPATDAEALRRTGTDDRELSVSQKTPAENWTGNLTETPARKGTFSPTFAQLGAAESEGAGGAKEQEPLDKSREIEYADDSRRRRQVDEGNGLQNRHPRFESGRRLQFGPRGNARFL